MRALLLAAALLLPGCGPTPPPPAPDTLDALRGQWVAINYWAEWCSPCIKEIPELNALDERYPGVSVLGVNFDGASGEELAEQEQRLGIAFPNLLQDPAEKLGVPRPQILPTTIILDPQGEVREILTGPQTLESLTRATAQAHEP